MSGRGTVEAFERGHVTYLVDGSWLRILERRVGDDVVRSGIDEPSSTNYQQSRSDRRAEVRRRRVQERRDARYRDRQHLITGDIDDSTSEDSESEEVQRKFPITGKMFFYAMCFKLMLLVSCLSHCRDRRLSALYPFMLYLQYRLLKCIVKWAEYCWRRPHIISRHFTTWVKDFFKYAIIAITTSIFEFLAFMVSVWFIELFI